MLTVGQALSSSHRHSSSINLSVLPRVFTWCGEYSERVKVEAARQSGTLPSHFHHIHWSVQVIRQPGSRNRAIDSTSWKEKLQNICPFKSTTVPNREIISVPFQTSECLCRRFYLSLLAIPILLRADFIDFFKDPMWVILCERLCGPWNTTICLEELNTVLPGVRWMNLITSWASLKSHNYIDRTQIVELPTPETKSSLRVSEKVPENCHLSLKGVGFEAKLND